MVTLGIDTSHAKGSVALAVDGDVEGFARFGTTSSHLAELGASVDRLLKDRELGVDAVSRVGLVVGPGSFTGLRVGMAYVKGLAAALDVEVVAVGTLELLAMPLLHQGGRVDARTAGAESAATGIESTERLRVCPMVNARKGEVYAAVYEWISGDVDEAVAANGGRSFNTAAADYASPTSLRALVEPRVESPEVFVESALRYRPLFLGTGANRYRHVVERAAGRGPIATEDTAIPSTPFLSRVACRLQPLSRSAVRSLEPFYIRPSDAVLTRLKPID